MGEGHWTISGKGQGQGGARMRRADTSICSIVDYMAARGAHCVTLFPVDTGQSASVHMRNFLVDTSFDEVLVINFFRD